METSDVISTIQAPPAPAAACARSEHAHFVKFAKISALFLAGLMAAILVSDHFMGMYLKSRGNRGSLAPEVDAAVENAGRIHKNIHVVFLGDSVSHQLFGPGTEGRPDVLFLTTNAAISVAGQCYLGETAMDHCPSLQDIYLIYLPVAWENNLPPMLTHDYFCGHFHTGAQVVEVLKLKRDFGLSFAHAGRWLMPNMMAANSLSRRAYSLSPMPGRQIANPAQSNISPAPDPDRLLTELSVACGPAADSIEPMAEGYSAVRLSPVSHYYLAKLREDCRRRGIRLHVLPSPVSDQYNRITYVDTQKIYDAPIIGDIPAAQLRDGIHFKREFVQAARDRMIRECGLTFLARPATLNE